MQRALDTCRIFVRVLQALHRGVKMRELCAAAALDLRQSGQFGHEFASFENWLQEIFIRSTFWHELAA